MAARTKFDLSAQALTESLGAASSRRFTQFFLADRGDRAKKKTFKLRLAGAKAVDCSLDTFLLAGGDEGLIVVEREAAEVSPKYHLQPSNTGKQAARSKKISRTAPPLSGGETGRAPRPVPHLTDDELSAFKAIGRKVRKLCREKSLAGITAAGARPPIPAHGANPALPAGVGARGLPDVFSAFDLVLFLAGDFRIIDIEGRAQRLGWRKPSLRGKPACEVLNFSEQAIFHRMAAKLNTKAARVSRETLLARDENGNPMPCRAALGRWLKDDAAYYFALISLDLPYRIRRLQLRAVDPVMPQRLAA